MAEAGATLGRSGGSGYRRGRSGEVEVGVAEGVAAGGGAGQDSGRGCAQCAARVVSKPGEQFEFCASDGGTT